jgi:hypothetical protein
VHPTRRDGLVADSRLFHDCCCFVPDLAEDRLRGWQRSLTAFDRARASSPLKGTTLAGGGGLWSALLFSPTSRQHIHCPVELSSRLELPLPSLLRPVADPSVLPASRISNGQLVSVCVHAGTYLYISVQRHPYAVEREPLRATAACLMNVGCSPQAICIGTNRVLQLESREMLHCASQIP